MKSTSLGIFTLVLAIIAIPVFAAAAESQYGPVKQSDNLWDISSRYQRNKGSRIVKWVQAIYKANPQAFNEGNLHRLKQGIQLRIPTLDEVKKVDYDDALNTLALHKTMLKKGIPVTITPNTLPTQQPIPPNLQPGELMTRLQAAKKAREEARLKNLRLTEKEVALQAKIIELRAKLAESTNRIERLKTDQGIVEGTATAEQNEDGISGSSGQKHAKGVDEQPSIILYAAPVAVVILLLLLRIGVSARKKKVDPEEANVNLNEDNDSIADKAKRPQNIGNGMRPNKRDEYETKLEIARSYIGKGDEKAAKVILEEVVRDGDKEAADRATEQLDGLTQG